KGTQQNGQGENRIQTVCFPNGPVQGPKTPKGQGKQKHKCTETLAALDFHGETSCLGKTMGLATKGKAVSYSCAITWAPWNSTCRGSICQECWVMESSFLPSFSSRWGSWVMHSRVGPAPLRQKAAPVVRTRASIFS